ncbi:MAG: outer membrane protein assembly factor BamD [Deltaproteobacteria bacterium]|nr:outer membrane protein assembly factor BamD [Deltaproteobacteria bacterium]
MTRRVAERRGRVARAGVAVLCVLCAVGTGGWLECTGSRDAEEPDLSYAESAAENYASGLESLEDGNSLEAQKYFEQVMRRFPYTREAVLSRLRLADCDFVAENFRAAATGYQTFIERYPADDEVPYAMFRRGLSFFNLIPSDWFIFPASYTRDRAPTRDALRELRSFIDRFPDSEYVLEARERIRDCLAELARGELSVAEFYLNREKPVAAALRARTVLREYGDSGLAPEALLLMGRIALEAGQRGAARGYFALLVARYPDSEESRRALRYLRFLEGRDEAP